MRLFYLQPDFLRRGEQRVKRNQQPFENTRYKQ